jgi:hypothetical protein
LLGAVALGGLRLVEALQRARSGARSGAKSARPESTSGPFRRG